MATPKKRARKVVRETRRELESAPPPAYFLSLTVANLRCFGPAQMLDLSDGHGRPARWTVLLGNNGVGKTSLLQFLTLCQAYSHTQAGPTASTLWYPEVIGARFLYSAKRSVEAEQEAGLARILATIYLGSDLVQGDPGRIVTNYGAEEKLLRADGDPRIVGLPASENLGGLICYAYGATRRMSTAALAKTEEPDSQQDGAAASLFSDTVSLLNAEEWLLQADYAALVESPSQDQARHRRDQIREMLIELLPDVSDIRFVRPTSDNWSTRVEVRTPYGWVRIRDLSLGYRTLIAWVVDLAYRLFERYPNSPNPLAEPAIVLVDEIDLHLHPRWQRTIMSYLTERFPNTQFIVTAHSPLIVQAATDANIVLLRREGDHVVIDNDVEAIRNWRIDQVLTSDLFGLETARPPDLDELMAERNRILGKSRLTKKDERRLKELDAAIGDLPTGETPEEMEAMEVIRRAAEVLKREGAAGR